MPDHQRAVGEPDPPSNIIEVDFGMRDINDAIEKLTSLAGSKSIMGLLFAVKLRGRNAPIFGSAGCCSNDDMATIGAATMLLNAVTKRHQMNE